MKTVVMLSVVCFLLIMEISSRTAEDKSQEKSREECRDSDECESDEDTSSSEEDASSSEEVKLENGRSLGSGVQKASLHRSYQTKELV